MKKIILGTLAGAAAILAGCSSSSSGDACATLYATQATLSTDYAPCFVDSGVTAPNDGGTQATCETALNSSSCTSADQTAAANLASVYQSCVNSVGVCSAGDAGGWATALGTCETKVVTIVTNDAGISGACTTALANSGVGI